MPPPSHDADSAPSAPVWTPTLDDERFREDRAATPADLDFSVEELLPIVVGAHLRGEIADRPLAARLARLIRSWQAAVLDPDDTALRPLVCSDVWFLNDRDLQHQPCIVIGDPGVNAASAHFAARLPRTYVVENHCAVQFDPQFLDCTVCIWGVDARATEAAFDAFATRYLDAYLRATHFV